jgi:hypothetical protein
MQTGPGGITMVYLFFYKNKNLPEFVLWAPVYIFAIWTIGCAIITLVCRLVEHTTPGHETNEQMHEDTKSYAQRIKESAEYKEYVKAANKRDR